MIRINGQKGDILKMKRLVLVLFTLGILFGSVPARANGAPVNNNKAWKAQMFIASQIKGIGLVDSYQEDNVDISYVYDNALAAMACMAFKDFGLAREILDTLHKEVKMAPQGVPYWRYLYENTSGYGEGTVYCGNTAWLLQALNVYQKLAKSKRYYSYQKKLANFLLTLQTSDGGLTGNHYVSWKSTENNLAAYAAIRNFGRLNKLDTYVAKADKIGTFLKGRYIWNGARFNQGKNDPTKVIDVQSLGVLVFGKKYATALTWAEGNLKTSKIFDSQRVTGFDFDNNLDTVWSEGTLQMALAFAQTSNVTKGDYYYNEISKTIQIDGSVLLATNTGTAGDWIMETWRAIAPTSWLIFYSLKFNPLVLY